MPESLGNPNLELKLYGTTSKEVQLTGSATDENNPTHVWTGLCSTPCAVAFRDKNNQADLTGLARIRWVTKMSGFHQVRPIVKLADGTLLIGDQAEGSTADYHQYDLSFSDCRWLRLDPVRGVTLGGSWVTPDLSRVEEVGVFDVIPGSGAWPADGLPVEKQPAPPAGGWIAVSAFELWGQPVKR